MTEPNPRLPGDDLPDELQPGPRLAEDLRALDGAPVSVPPEVDARVLAAIGAIDRRRPRVLSWRPALTAAAAAALLLVGITWGILPLFRPEPVAPELVRAGPERGGAGEIAEMAAPRAAASPSDLDRNGRVDILDAYLLARRIEDRASLDPTWDLNADGIVDSDDVDTLALAVVRVP